MKRGMMTMFCAIVVGCGSQTTQTANALRQEGLTKAASFGPPDDPAALAQHARGAEIMGRYLYKDAEPIFAELATRYPQWLEVHVDWAIATLNRDQRSAQALPILQKVIERDPENLRARFVAGFLLNHDSKPEEALPHLLKVAETDPTDGFVAYFIGNCYQSLDGKEDQAIEWFRKAIQLDPQLGTALYGLKSLLRIRGESQEAEKLTAVFDALRANPYAEFVSAKYRRIGPKANIYPVTKHPPMPAGKVPPGDPFSTTPVDLAKDAPWPIDGVKPPISITACDMNGDGRVDLFFAPAPKGVPAAMLQQADGTFTSSAGTPPFSMEEDANAPLWGDFDNDNRTDVFLCRRRGNQLWRQATKSNWENHNTIGGAVFDADHDGDLDLFLIRADGPNELLSNNGNGTFRALAAERGIAGSGKGSKQVLVLDHDGDGDQDLVVINKTAPHDVFTNERTWSYTSAKGFDKFKATAIDAAIVANLTGGGIPEIYTLGPAGVGRWQRGGHGNWDATPLHGDTPYRTGKPVWLAAADVDGDGQLELLIAGNGWQAFKIESKTLQPIMARRSGDLLGFAVVNLAPERGPSVVTVDATGPMLWGPGPGRMQPYISYSFTGDKDVMEPVHHGNRSGIGVRSATRLGARWIVQYDLSGQSGPGQSLQPITVGTAGAKQVDSVVIDWPNAVFQVELDLAAGKLHTIHEVDRTPTSCPIIFVWNGTRHEFVSDVLGVGGLGYLVKPGEYAPPRPRESFLLPQGMLQAKDGLLSLKLVEPSEEITYLDAARLVAYDLPPGWKLTLDERMGLAKPMPTGAPRTYRRELLPQRVVNETGRDVASALAKVDHEYAPLPPLDRRFVGRLEREQVLTLSFAEPLDKGPGEPLLIADGWVEFPYSTTAFAAWQAGAVYAPPTLEARGADGKWTTILKEFGYPAGMPRQMSVPLVGLPKGATELRLRTNLQVSWDRLMVVWVVLCSEMRRTSLPLDHARVAHCGFPAFGRLAHMRPHFTYEEKRESMPSRVPFGYYTRFGDCRELLAETDDATAIFGPGEETHLDFRAPTTALPDGWSRWIVLELDGWCKDMDLYTGDNSTVEPLPTSGKPAAVRDRLHRKYNTRIGGGR